MLPLLNNTMKLERHCRQFQTEPNLLVLSTVGLIFSAYKLLAIPIASHLLTEVMKLYPVHRVVGHISIRYDIKQAMTNEHRNSIEVSVSRILSAS